MKGRIILDALAAATTAGTLYIVDRLTGQDPAHRGLPTADERRTARQQHRAQRRTGRR
jgi:hypothetical protein